MRNIYLRGQVKYYVRSIIGRGIRVTVDRLYIAHISLKCLSGLYMYTV